MNLLSHHMVKYRFYNQKTFCHHQLCQDFLSIDLTYQHGNIISCYQAFQVGINCKVCILSLNGVVSFNKLSLVHETVRYLVYSEVMKKGVLRQQIAAVTVTHVHEKKYAMETIIRAISCSLKNCI